MNSTATAASADVAANSTSTYALTGNYNLAVGYLRAFITLLVLAHHAALAYHPYAPPLPASLLAQPRLWQAFPVLDSNSKWMGTSFLVGFNDIFFMSLMFFLSGLFVYRSLEHKGVKTFLRDRLLRLGLPFVVAAAVVAPLAYYPAYLQTPSHAGIAGYWQQWRGFDNWPAGPAWFIWLLLAFDVIAAILFVAAPRLSHGSQTLPRNSLLVRSRSSRQSSRYRPWHTFHSCSASGQTAGRHSGLSTSRPAACCITSRTFWSP